MTGVRPIVLALGEPSDMSGGEPMPPALRRLGGRSLLSRLLSSLDDAGLPRALVAVPAEHAAAARATVGDLADVVPVVERSRCLALRECLELTAAGETVGAPGTGEAVGAPGTEEAVGAPGAGDAGSAPGAGNAPGTGDAASAEPLVLVHDAERALTPVDIIRAVLEGMGPGIDAVVPTVDVTDSVKSASTNRLSNVDRSGLAVVQAPRLYRRGVLEDAVRADVPAQADELDLVLERGAAVRTVAGSHAGFAVVDRLTLWQAQISLGLARDTSHRAGLRRRG